MTLYDKGPFVEEAVRSVLVSTFPDFELLVVDDASSDDGASRVAHFGDQRVRIHRNAKNLGRARNANLGFSLAQGEYIAILDADDRMHPERLAKQVAFMDAHPEVGACGTWAQLIGDRSNIARWPATDAEARGLLLFEDPLLYGSAMLRRSVLLAHGLRCPDDWDAPGMDYLFLLRLAAAAQVANLQEPLTYYRLGPNNFRHDRDRTADSIRILREALNSFGLSPSRDELNAHLVLTHRAAPPDSAEGIRALNAWASRLLLFNAERAIFTPRVFSSRVREELDRVFFILAQQRSANAMLHLRLSGGWSIRRARYYFSLMLHGRRA
jgi:glycosyltransferase involved in cell wall biosynthesis